MTKQKVKSVKKVIKGLKKASKLDKLGIVLLRGF